MHKRESVFENKVHKIFWDFDILKIHQIPVRRQDFVLLKKKWEVVVLWISLFEWTTKWK